MLKLYLEVARSWSLLFPIPIRIRHETVDPGFGYSPYQMVFWGDSPGFGIPWPVVWKSREAAECMVEREIVQKELGGVLRKKMLTVWGGQVKAGPDFFQKATDFGSKDQSNKGAGVGTNLTGTLFCN